MVNGFACRTEFQNALTVCPDNILPDASVTVPEIISGRRTDCSSKMELIAKSAALQLRVSKTVSTNIMSTPPSIRALVCS